MMKNITNDGSILALGLVGLVAVAGVARAGWKGERAGAQMGYGYGSGNQVSDILDAYGYTGETRARWKRQLESLSQPQLDYVHSQVVG